MSQTDVFVLGIDEANARTLAEVPPGRARGAEVLIVCPRGATTS